MYSVDWGSLLPIILSSRSTPHSSPMYGYCRHVNKEALCSKMTLNYWMMVERYPNLKEEFGGSNPGCEISFLLDRKTCHEINCLLCFGVGMSAFFVTKQASLSLGNKTHILVIHVVATYPRHLLSLYRLLASFIASAMDEREREREMLVVFCLSHCWTCVVISKLDLARREVGLGF